MQSGRLRSFPKLAHPRGFCTPRCCRSVCECFGFDAPVAGPGCGTPSRGAETHRGPSLLDQRFASRRRRGDSPLRTKNRRRAIRANMIRKRTCSMCGKTAPNSSPSFAYCGGCHGFQLRECIPRFCSEACQHAHWHAGHKHECPCAKDL